MSEASTPPPGGITRRLRRLAKLGTGALRQLRVQGGLKNAMLKGWRLYCQVGLHGLLQRMKMLASADGVVAPAAHSGEFDRHDYTEWLRRYDNWPPERLAGFASNVCALPSHPRFRVYLPAQDAVAPDVQEATMASVKAQRYGNWVVDSDADWVILLAPGAVLAEHALLHLVEEINREPSAQLIYCDEDRIDPDGIRSQPHFKPEWNPLLFYSTGWLGSMVAVREAIVREMPQLHEACDDPARLEALLRIVETVDERHIRRVARVLVHRRSDLAGHLGRPTPTLAGAQSLEAHFNRQGRAATVAWGGFAYRVRYTLPQPFPLASIIIPTRNGLSLMKQCVESLYTRSTYPNFEVIIVDNGSDDPQALAYFAELAQRPNLCVIRDESPFNYSALNNMAVRQAQGEIIVLMNNDIEILTPDWLEEMVSFALQPEVGAVGARLLYPDGTVQHAGVMLGIRGVAGHVHKDLHRTAPGYQGRAALVQNLSAVTAACLAVRKSVWEEVGGLNETDLKVAFNDVDFCIRLVQAGYRNVYTPYAELYHHESASRGTEDSPEKLARFAHEVHYMMSGWAAVLPADRAYNPGLTLEDEDFSLAWPPRYNS